ncbi:uncharacterized protein [Euwallacea similis]|uniref:uncharacterized protein n=1 Tax=Euwallacea similis TaxID=1736056 RepID=UPI003450F37D
MLHTTHTYTTKFRIPAPQKADIVKYMKSKGMEIPTKATRKVLLQMVKQQNFKKEYVIDNFFQTRGYTILRLPPYYCIFNPIEMVWAAIKKRLRKNNQSPELGDSVIDNIKTVIKELNETNLWKKCVSHVKTVENEYYVLPSINPIIINTDDVSSSEDCDSED